MWEGAVLCSQLLVSIMLSLQRENMTLKIFQSLVCDLLRGRQSVRLQLVSIAQSL